MKSIVYFLLFTVVPLTYLKAQPMQQLNAAEIKQALESLNVTGSVLYIAAHPDDENTRLLAYLAKEKKVRTGYLSLTRGDGGQNLIGNEQAELLGLIRTQELLAARRMDGAEQFFTRANDFGFSKNSDEAFKIWNKEKILSDVVWVIRKFRPDVIITRFPEDSRAGHGHHSGSAILAHEAFTAAADPTRFPEQLKMVKPWQAKRIFWNTFNFGGNNTTSEDQLKIDVGAFNPLLGESYGEIAAESRSNHKSQGFGSARQRGSSTEYFTLTAGAAARDDIFDGIDLSLDRVKGSSVARELLAEINNTYEVSDPSKSINKLLKLRELVKEIPFKHEQLDDVVLACAGIWLESTAGSQSYALGEEVDLRVQAIARVKSSFTLPITVKEKNTGASMELKPNQLVYQDKTMSIAGAKISQPYWLEKDHGTGSYEVTDQKNIGMPQTPPGLTGDFIVQIGDQLIEKILPVVYKYTDQVRGEVYQPLVLAPPVTATLADNAFVFNGTESKTIAVVLHAFKNNAAGTLTPKVPQGWKVVPEKVQFTITRKGEEQIAEFKLSPEGSVKNGLFSTEVNVDGKTYQRGLHVINYPHIPVQTLFPPAEAKVSSVNLKLDGKHIAYLDGAGDLVAQSLKQIGYEVVNLSDYQALHADLSKYDAIITGVRRYNVSDQMQALQPRLLKYVEEGGTLLVQYNVNAPLRIENLGPYPFRLSRDRVTEEDAKVTLLKPEDQAFNFPNKITEKDFDGWVQERGLYFVTDADVKYTPLLSMHDTGEPGRTGSLIVADFGKGRYVYTGISFFRQLPAGVPGAYRLFVNLLSRKQ